MRTGRPERWIALLCLAAATAAGAADFGTLFNTPEERARLDALRRGEPAGPAGSVAGPREVTGYVKRSDGRATVFVNGIPVPTTNARAAPLLDPKAIRSRNEDVKVERAGSK